LQFPIYHTLGKSGLTLWHQKGKKAAKNIGLTGNFAYMGITKVTIITTQNKAVSQVSREFSTSTPRTVSLIKFGASCEPPDPIFLVIIRIGSYGKSSSAQPITITF